MTDIDNYLVNCIYQQSENVPEKEIEEIYDECACKYGMKELNTNY